MGLKEKGAKEEQVWSGGGGGESTRDKFEEPVRSPRGSWTWKPGVQMGGPGLRVDVGTL